MGVQSLGWEESPGEGNGNPLQYSCLENPTDRGAWRATVRGVKKSQTRLKQLSTHTYTCQQHQVFTNRGQGEKREMSFQQFPLHQKANECILNAVLD